MPELAATPLLVWDVCLRKCSGQRQEVLCNIWVVVKIMVLLADHNFDNYPYSCCTPSLAKTPLVPPVGGQLDVLAPRNQRWTCRLSGFSPDKRSPTSEVQKTRKVATQKAGAPLFRAPVVGNRLVLERYTPVELRLLENGHPTENEAT